MWDKIKLIPKKQLYLSLFGLFLFVAGFHFLTSNSTNIVLLYKPTDHSEMTEILYILNKYGVDYSQKEEAIYVSTEELTKARIILSEEGLPRNGSIIGYEIFNKNEFLGTSNFAQNINFMRALEGELSRTITSFDSIKHARVHLVIPKKELFSHSKQTPSASVIVQLYKDKELTRKAIKSISHLVSSSVPQLDIGNITIVGTDGKNYKLADGGEEGETSGSMYEYKINLERQIKESVENLGIKMVGYGKIIAEVTVDIDMKHQVTDSEVYDPSQQIIRSSHTVSEDDSESIGSSNNVSVENNIPNQNSRQGAGGDSSQHRKNEELLNYEISKSINKINYLPGSIKNISIGILIDGEYDVNEEGTSVYKPRSSDFINSFKKLIASAIGINYSRGDKLEIINMQFFADNIADDESLSSGLNDFYPIIQALIYATVIIIGMLMFIKPLLSILRDNVATKKQNIVSMNKQGIEGESQAKNESNKVIAEVNVKDAEISQNNNNDANKKSNNRIDNDDKSKIDLDNIHDIPIDDVGRNIKIIEAFVLDRADIFINVVRSVIFNDEQNIKRDNK